MRWAAGWATSWATLLDAVFPPRCAGCGRVGEHFCPACARSVQPVPAPWCPRCGSSMPVEGLCPECRRDPLPLRGVRSAGLLDGPLRRAVHRLKYRGRRQAAPALALLLQVPLRDLLNGRKHGAVIVPVPLHPHRERERGYNQAAVLAAPLAAAAALPCLSALARTRSTVPQVGLSRPQRRANLRGAFEATTSLAGKTVILVDDVTTTGSTLGSAAQACLDAGAAAVCAVTLAREA